MENENEARTQLRKWRKWNTKENFRRARKRMRMLLEKVTMNVSYKCLIVKTVNVWKLLNGFVLMLTLFCFYYYYSTKVHLYT